MSIQKIIEIKNNDWVKGQSAHANIALGGLFQQLLGVDPFEQGGLGLPSLTPAQQTLATTPKFITNYNTGGTRYLFVQSDTKLYQVLTDSPYTVVDLTSSITAAVVQGAIIWKNRYIYATVNDIRSITFAATGDSQLKSGYNDGSMDYRAFCIGADGNLYYGDSPRVGILTAVTGTTGNSTSKDIDTGFIIRDIVNDGRYLVIFADNNTDANSGRLVGDYICRIYFWDMVQSDAAGRLIPDVMYDFKDSYIISAKNTDNGIEMITYDGIYALSSGTKPKMIRAFPVTASNKMGRPLNPSQVVYKKGSLYWVDGFQSTFNYIYAYGNPITGQQKIFYVPYNETASSNLATCLAVAGNNFIKGTSLPALYFFNTGSTRGSATIQTVDTNMSSPHEYIGTKVVLSQPLSSGQSVQCVAYTQNHNTLISNETKSYNASNPKQNLLFRPVRPTSNQPNRFEDIDVQVQTNAGAAVQRIAVYANPQDDLTEDI